MFQGIGMKKLMLWFVVIVATPGSALFAQDTSGTPKIMAADARPQPEVATTKPSQSREVEMVGH